MAVMEVIAVEHLEFVYPTLIAGQRHKGINIRNPLWSAYEITLEDDWVKLENSGKDYRLWVPREQVAMLVPLRVAEAPAVVVAPEASPPVITYEVVEGPPMPVKFTIGDAAKGIAPVVAPPAKKPRKKPGRKPGSRYAKPATNN